MIALGLTGVFWPEGVMQLAIYSFTATGLFVAGAARVVLGGLLFFASSATRTPKTIRVIGLIILLGGIATAVTPSERVQFLKDWWQARSPDTFRIVACLPLIAGIFVGVSTLTKERR